MERQHPLNHLQSYTCTEKYGLECLHSRGEGW